MYFFGFSMTIMGLVEVRSVGITKDVLQVAVSTHQKQVTSDKDMYQKQY